MTAGEWTMVKFVSSMTLALFLCGLLAGSAEAAEGTLSIRLSNEDRLLVFIDGEERGETPLEISLKSGRYSIEVKAAEYSVRMVSGDAVVRDGQVTALIGDWEAGTFTEDLAATTGQLAGIVRLRSGVGLPLSDSDLKKLASSAAVKLSCGDEDHPIAASQSSSEAGAVVLKATVIPVGSCEITAQALNQTHKTTFAVQAGTEASVDSSFAVQWSRVLLKRLEGSDTAQVTRPGAGGMSLQAGVVSPLAPPGDLEVTVSHSGTAVRVASASGHVGLLEVEAYGELVIPEGAVVPGMTLQIDGASVALASSYTLPVGQHTIRSAAPGRHPQTVTVSITAGASQPWSATLEEVLPGEVLATVVGPETWMLSASGTESTDGKSLALNPGTHTVRVQAPGWTAAEQEVEVLEGKTQTLAFELQITPISVVWTGLSGEAQLTLSDGEGKQTNPAIEGGRAQATLAPGPYTWEVTAPKTTPQTGTLELAIGDAEQEVPVSLARYPVAVFSDLVAGAQVTLRGNNKTKELKAEGSELRVTLPPGTYEWEVRADLKEPDSGTIELVVSDEPIQIAVKLPLLKSVSKKRRNAAVTAALAGGAGGFAGVGVYFVADAQDLYGFAVDQHAQYEAATAAEDARWFGDQAFDAREIGQQKELIGIGLIAAGSALAVVAVIHALRSKAGAATKVKSETKTVGVSLVPGERGLSIGIGGQW